MKAFASMYISDDLSKKLGIEVLPLRPYQCLDLPVNTHADMLVFILENKIFTYRDYYIQNKEIFDKAANSGYEIVTVSKECSKKYPNDIGLNVLMMGKVLFSNLAHTAKEILDFAREKNYKLVNVKQGYSACSTLVLDKNNAITADKGICKVLRENGKNVLLISDKEISLEGYNCGFIGGASCVIDKNVCFFGDITKHTNYLEISAKLKDLSMKEICISWEDVADFGGVKVVFDNKII